MADKQKTHLKAVNLEKTFPMAGQMLHVLKGLDFEILAGESVAIMGASGAGKSTLLHILGTLDRPSNGKIFYFNEEPPFHNDQELCFYRNRHIGFVFQFHHLLPEFSALENVMMPLLISGKNVETATQMGQEILGKVGLKDRLKHKPGELSGGEQQRVAIARAIVGNPTVLLADEPTGNLDSATGNRIFSLLMDVHKEFNQSIIMATHNQELAEKMDRILHMEDGVLREI